MHRVVESKSIRRLIFDVRSMKNKNINRATTYIKGVCKTKQVHLQNRIIQTIRIQMSANSARAVIDTTAFKYSCSATEITMQNMKLTSLKLPIIENGWKSRKILPDMPDNPGQTFL